MKIAFEAQPLLNSKKTGIAYCEQGLTLSIIENHPGDSFSFEFFSSGNHSENIKMLEIFNRENVEFKYCKWFPKRLYKLITLVLPVPYKWFIDSGADVTHFFNYIIPPFVRGKTVVTVHDLTFMAYPETMDKKNRIIMKLLAHRSMRRADKIIAVSEFTKSEIIKYFDIPEDKIGVVYNGVDLSAYRNDFSADEIACVKQKYGISGEYFLYLGTLEPRKNLIRLINAYSQLKKKYGNAPDLVIAGKKGWLYQSIFDVVKADSIEDFVFFTDYVPDEDAHILLNGAMAFCYPSLYEGFGMPVAEAMACGTPVITSNCSSMPEVAGDCAILASPESEDEIFRAMEQLFTNEDLRKRLSADGRKRAEKFIWKDQADRLYEIYRNLCV